MSRDPRTQQLLREVADAGVLDVFIVYRTSDGEWGHCYRVSDMGEALFELRTAAIQARLDIEPEEQELRGTA